MSKKETIKFDASDAFRDNDIIPLIATYGRYFLYGLAALIAFLLIFFRISSNKAANTEVDFISADNDFKEFQEASFSNGQTQAFNDSLNSLTLVVDRHSDLQAKFDAPIGEILLIENQAEKAAPFIERSLDRTQNSQTPYYQDFAKTTLSVSQGKYQEALSQATLLQDKMNQSINEKDALARGYSDQLYILNLLRIATLNQQLDNGQAEADTLNKLSLYIQEAKTKSPETKKYIDGFTEGKATLNQYIDLRKKTLKEKTKP
jgi:hypothetical protein